MSDKSQKDGQPDAPSLVASAPGKLILLGEYAVLEGAPAVVAAIDRYARVEVTPTKTGRMSVAAPTLGIEPIAFVITDSAEIQYEGQPDRQTTDQLRFFETTFNHALAQLSEAGLSLSPGAYRLDTSSFYDKQHQIKLGFGSSAALTVALLAAMLGSAGGGIVTEDDLLYLFQNAMDAHHAAQGKVGSGIDIAASSFGGVLQYQIIFETVNHPTMIEEIELPPDLRMLFVWSGKSASTTELVGQVRAFQHRSPGQYDAFIKEMHDIAASGGFALLNRETTSFLDAALAYGNLMCRLGEAAGADIYSAEHRQILQLAETSGAAYKPSGAGGGDFGIAFTNTDAALQSTRQAIEAAGFKTIDLSIVHQGVTITENRRD